MGDVNAWFGMILARSDYLHAKKMIWEEWSEHNHISVFHVILGYSLYSLLLVDRRLNSHLHANLTAPESIEKNNLDGAILHLDPYHRFWFYFATSVTMESSLCMVFFQSRRPSTKWVNPWGGTGSCWRSWMHHDDSFKGLSFSACFGESINLILWWFAMLSEWYPDLKWFEPARRIWMSWMSSMLHAFKNFRPNHQWTIDFSSGSIKLTTGCEKGASEAFSQKQCPKLEVVWDTQILSNFVYFLDSQWIHLGRCGCYQSLESHGSFV